MHSLALAVFMHLLFLNHPLCSFFISLNLCPQSELPQNDLVLAFTNIRSITNKYTSFSNFVLGHDIHGFGISETWLTTDASQSQLSEITPPGYFLEILQSIPSDSLMFGDVNIDPCKHKSASLKYSELLHLTQHVSTLTHLHGGIPDHFIAPKSANLHIHGYFSDSLTAQN